MKPLGPTILEVLNCGFHKTKGEKARSKILAGREKQQQQHNTGYNDPSALANPYVMFLYALNSPVTRERDILQRCDIF
jgi:hypothetical protein